jgi:hypothetical protein
MPADRRGEKFGGALRHTSHRFLVQASVRREADNSPPRTSIQYTQTGTSGLVFPQTVSEIAPLPVPVWGLSRMWNFPRRAQNSDC